MSEYFAIIDGFNLTVTAIVAVGSQLIFGVVTYALKKEYLADIGVAITTMAIAFLACFAGFFSSRSIAAMAMVVCWAFWIGAFHLTRILKAGGRSARFDSMRGNLWRTVGFFAGQGVWLWVALLPLFIVCSPRGSYPGEGGAYFRFATSLDLAGIVIFSFGFVYEMISDVHRDVWQSRHGRDGPSIQSGLWALSRHANMFGRLMMFWGLYILSIGAANDRRASTSARAALYTSIVGPLSTTVVILVVNVRNAEALAARRAYAASASRDPNAWSDYQTRVASTSLLLPCPRALYSRLPSSVKRTIFLDMSGLRFDSNREGAVVIEDERRKHSEELSGSTRV